jgi:membrane protein DedA with SNARE-associated domain
MPSEQITRETLIDRRLAVVTTAIASIYGISLVSVALLPLLAREVPHLLILLNPATGVLLVVSARVGLIPFLALAVLRRVLLHILFFLLGEWYGESAVRWVEGRSGRTSQFVTYVERAFARLSWPVILLAAGPLPSVLAGAGGMRRAHFLAIDLTGTVLSVLVARYAADIVADPLGAALRFSDRHAGLLTALCVAATGTWLLIRWWRGRFGGTPVGEQ